MFLHYFIIFFGFKKTNKEISTGKKSLHYFISKSTNFVDGLGGVTFSFDSSSHLPSSFVGIISTSVTTDIVISLNSW